MLLPLYLNNLLSVGGDATANVTGASIAGEAGTVTPTYDWSQNVTGAASAAEAGTVIIDVSTSIDITGAAIAAEAGTSTSFATTIVNITGAEISVDAGTITVTGDANYTLTGAESPAEAGTVSTTTTATVDFGPLGLTHKAYGNFRKDVLLLGASTQASAGVVQVITTIGRRQQLGPHGLVTYPRNFSKVSGDVSVNITGAQIQGQQQSPDIADTDIYIDGAEIGADAGTVIADAVTDEVVQLTGAEIAGEAGTSAGLGTTPVSITGAEISADAGAVTAFGTGDVFVTVLGAQTDAEAGTVTAAYDWAQGVTGAEINALHNEVGLDTNTDLSVTVYAGTIEGEAGTVTYSPIDATVSDETKGYSGRKRRKQRYIVEIDNEYFEVRNVAEAQELFAKVRELAEQQAETDVELKPVKIRVRTGTGAETRQSTILSEIRTTKQTVDRAREEQKRRQQVNKEISELMLAKIAEEDEEEEAIIALLLS